MGWFSRNLPPGLLGPLRDVRQVITGKPRIGEVDFGQLRRLRPIDSSFGTTRGLPVDRYYIEEFLRHSRLDIRGRVLEVGDATYTRAFGDDGVSQTDILHVHDRNPSATIVADLQDAPHIPDHSFDCIILTQVLPFIFQLEAAVHTLRRILRSNGVLLVTVPGISQIATQHEWGDTWFWSFTDRSVRRLLETEFGPAGVEVATHGNVLAAVAHLQGIASSELTPEELDDRDPDYQVIISARAVKLPGDPASAAPR